MLFYRLLRESAKSHDDDTKLNLLKSFILQWNAKMALHTLHKNLGIALKLHCCIFSSRPLISFNLF